MIKRFSFGIMVLVAVILSLTFPAPFIEIGGFQMKLLIVPLLQLIMFGMGTAMSLKDFYGVLKMPKGVVVGMVCQLTIMPLVGWGIATTFGFPPEIAAGIILVGASPSGLASNVMSYLAKANLALSVTLTAVATMLAPLFTPFLMEKLAGTLVPIDFWGMMASIFKIVIIPIVMGILFNRVAFQASKKQGVLPLVAVLGVVGAMWWLDLTEWAWVIAAGWLFVFAGWILQQKASFLKSVMPVISMIGIGLIITVITASGRDSLLEVGWLLLLACLIHNASGYALGYGACKVLRMDEKDCRTIALEVGMQNSGLASGLALEMGKLATVGLAPAVFGPLMNVSGSSLAMFWRGKSEKNPA
ncbi:MAG: bile acid:sodium symporter family protein [Bacteroidia bacterium]|nr:bile acid:sodium symporter family protein [Bacteroidia bacterium]